MKIVILIILVIVCIYLIAKCELWQIDYMAKRVVETQKRYNDYEKAEKEIEESEADIKEHIKADGLDKPKKPFTQADMRAWQMKNNKKP